MSPWSRGRQRESGRHNFAHLEGNEAANRDNRTPKLPITIAMLNAEERP